MDCNKNEVDEINRNTECMQRSVETNNNFESNKEIANSGYGEIDTAPQDGTKNSESREGRIRRIKERSELERQRKYSEIVESQRQANELRQKQQDDRRKKIEELKQREEERKKKVEQRRQEMDVKEKEKNENLLRRTKEREARALVAHKLGKMVPTMTQSMTLANQTRVTTISTSQDKCKRVYHRSSSGCDVTRAGAGSKRPRVPEGYIEVGGHLVPAGMRHIGCFVPGEGPVHRVTGVLAWGPRPVGACGGRGGVHQEQGHRRAASAHAVLSGPKTRLHKSTPQTDKSALCPPFEHNCFRNSPKMTKSMSERSARSSVPSSNRLLQGTDVTPTPRIRSSSRPKAIATSVTMTTKNQSLYDRLSRPRGESQPPKERTIDPSLIRQGSTRPAKKLVTKPAITVDRVNSHKRRSLPISAPDSGITSSPASEVESVLDAKIDPQMPEVPGIPFIADDVTLAKTHAIKNNKNLHSKEHHDLAGHCDGDSADHKAGPGIKEEELYRAKLMEQRRLAREAKERQQEEQRIMEQEAKERAVAEKRRIEEETKQIMDEEVKRLKLLEEEEQAAREKQKADEEIDRMKKQDLEREIEEKRAERSRSEDTDRMERKRRLEKIMSRVKKSDESASQSNEESGLMMSEVLENSVCDDRATDPGVEAVGPVESVPVPREAWPLVVGPGPTGEEADDPPSKTDSPSLISDDVLDLPCPQTNSSCMTQTWTSTPGLDEFTCPPQFKSRLLQSLVSTGRLTTTEGPIPATNILSSPSLDSDQDCAVTHSLASGQSYLLFHRPDQDEDGHLLSKCRSYDNDISIISDSIIDQDMSSAHNHSFESQIKEGASSSPSKHHSDTDNEAATLSSIASSNVDPVRLSLDVQVPRDCGASCSQSTEDRGP